MWGVGRGAWGAPPILQFFSPPIKTDGPHGMPLLLTNEAPHLKNNPPPLLKSEALFQEMIPRQNNK